MSRRRQRPSSPSDAPFSPSSRAGAAGFVLLGLIIGLAGALYYAWIVAPVVYTDASPSRFSEQYKEEYIFLVSQNYAADGDWEKAERRLKALDDPDLPQTVADLLERYLREQRPSAQIRNLATIAQKLGAEGRTVALFAPTPLSGLPTATPTAVPTQIATSTPTPPPTATPSPTPSPTITPLPTFEPTPTPPPAVYRLLYQQRLCDGGDAPRIEVETVDAALNPLAGVKTIINWENGRDQFFTGFKPALGAGVGDFTMEPTISYSVVLADGSPEVSGLRVEQCGDGRLGGWRLTFQNLLVEVEAEEDE